MLRTFALVRFLPIALAALVACARATPVDPANVAETIFVQDSLLNPTTGIAWAPDGSRRLFVAKKTGGVRIVRDGAVSPVVWAAESPFTGGESVVFLKLKEYKDARCAETVAAFLTVDLKRAEAAEVLKVIGQPAEPAVVPYSQRAAPNGAAIPFATRLAAIELLGDIGTKECVPLLRQHAMELTVQAHANKALAKVLARTKGK